MKAALEKLYQYANESSGNLLAAAVEAARERATLGEISDAMERAFGRYVPTTRSVSGVYSKAIKMNDYFKKAQQMADEFAEMDGYTAESRAGEILLGAGIEEEFGH